MEDLIIRLINSFLKIYFMKSIFLKRICFFLFIICLSAYVNAQQRMPKNYFGISGIAELTRLSVGCGVEYERWFHTTNQWAFGAKANHIFPSKTLNLFFASDELLQKNSQTHVMSTVYYFTSKKKKTEGFFLSFGFGANFIKWSRETSDPSNPDYHFTISKSVISPGLDVSLGGQSVFKNSTAIRLTMGYEVFFTSSNIEFFSENGMLLLYTKISIGF